MLAYDSMSESINLLSNQLESCKNDFYEILLEFFKSANPDRVSDMDFISGQIVQLEKIRLQIASVQESLDLHFHQDDFELPFE